MCCFQAPRQDRKPRPQKNHYQTTPRPAYYDKKRCKTLEEPMWSTKHSRQPPHQPERWRNGQGRWEGSQPLQKAIKPRKPDRRSHKRFPWTGLQTPRSPRRPFPRPVPPSTPSRRRERRYGPREGAAGAGGFAGRSARFP